MKRNQLLYAYAFRLMLILAALFCLPNLTIAQDRQVAKGSKSFDAYSFINARDVYLDVVEKGFTSKQIYEKLGDSYYYNSNYKKAAEWYLKIESEFGEINNPELLYRITQSLKSIGDKDNFLDFKTRYEQISGQEASMSTPNYQMTNAEYDSFIVSLAASLNSETSDFGATVFNGSVYFASSRQGGLNTEKHGWNNQPYLDIYSAKILEDGSIGTVQSFSDQINSKYHESSVCFTSDGNTMYFTRNNYIEGKRGRDKKNNTRLKIYRAQKSETGQWDAIMEVPFNSDDYSNAHPFLNADETRLYFSSDMPGSIGMSDLWYVAIDSQGNFGPPINLGPSINTPGREGFPFIGPEEIFYFTSEGHDSFGGLDIYSINLNDSDPAPINLGVNINTADDDFAFYLNETKDGGYFSSNRNGDQGSLSDDIYKFEKQCIVTIQGIVLSEITGEPLVDAEVFLIDNMGQVINTTKTDASGFYKFDDPLGCEQNYRIRGNAPLCETAEESVLTPDTSATLKVDVKLDCGRCALNDLGCRLDLQPIYFDLDRYNIRPDAAIELAKILVTLEQFPEIKLNIESHTDSRATFEYNEVLSERRAQSTRNWLIENGIAPDRLAAKGFGEYQLVNECADDVDCTEEQHQLNRRSMFLIQE